MCAPGVTITYPRAWLRTVAWRSTLLADADAQGVGVGEQLRALAGDALGERCFRDGDRRDCGLDLESTE
ncbi:hypothetical protein [Streptomyces neyagawaensis]|uniref:hypothetical protein n=1 Tax=Streptomyces neyagawaensis TaxID=42238 RepID=UPI0006E427F1|nr:hypothetical protein [Streptomyces neyagawaensis]MCL6737445.1 hypothetical protein [Streptomyces neyagawaensis]MDE1688271.1 hypothetical protein [Streptomyces neyagawaensis]